ncbi:hypothetical protein [Kineococcus rhizosphaerae]|uniref:Uncharacterized protein n=1 Tax=Kineococcus rhizosphaerae TaxID=559628 RepID=A0A2T0QXE7_9ACTN|nr:hypothetical protein [Kineococcus rhizosphaerae]PRY10559.1 hypothetical protein CLV37_116112 [Kineococcus rhizosphaerae]
MTPPTTPPTTVVDAVAQALPPSAPLPVASPHDDLVAGWWAGLSPARQQQVRGLEGSEPLPRWAATELGRAGVSCPLTLVDEHGRLVRRALAPEALVRLLSTDVLS